MNLEAEPDRGPIDRFHPLYDIVKHWLVDVVVWENHMEALALGGGHEDEEETADSRNDSSSTLVRPGSHILLKNVQLSRHKNYDPADGRMTHEVNLHTGTRFGRKIILLAEGNPIGEELKTRLADALQVLRPAGATGTAASGTMSSLGNGSSFSALAELASSSNSQQASTGGEASTAAMRSNQSFSFSAVDDDDLRRMGEEEEQRGQEQENRLTDQQQVQQEPTPLLSPQNNEEDKENGHRSNGGAAEGGKISETNQNRVLPDVARDQMTR